MINIRTMNSLKTFLFISFIFLCHLTEAAKVDTVVTYSAAMQKEIKAVMITPDSYTGSKALPVIYLLHGYSGNYANGWAIRKYGVDKLVDQCQVIAVCPDGGYNSWYFDSPMVKSYRYETYISRELVDWVDAHYRTIKSPKGRGITGLSMGGHGALYLAFKHQDVFGVAGSMSGGVDIRPFPKNWDMAKYLGSYAEYPENWEKNTVINLVHLLTPYSLALIIDCGTEDFFYQVNCRLHEKLQERNIPHQFTTRPGGHDWKYWEVSTTQHFSFMSDFFQNP